MRVFNRFLVMLGAMLLTTVGVDAATVGGFPSRPIFQSVRLNNTSVLYFQDTYRVVKIADANVISNTTLASDSELQMPLSAGFYSFRCYIQFVSTVAATGYKYGFNYSGSLSPGNPKYLADGFVNLAAVNAAGAFAGFQSYPTIDTVANFARIEGSIQTTTAGTFAFQWAQATSTATNTTTVQGSNCIVSRLK
jgi:hypothetical protein